MPESRRPVRSALSASKAGLWAAAPGWRNLTYAATALTAASAVTFMAPAPFQTEGSPISRTPPFLAHRAHDGAAPQPPSAIESEVTPDRHSETVRRVQASARANRQQPSAPASNAVVQPSRTTECGLPLGRTPGWAGSGVVLKERYLRKRRRSHTRFTNEPGHAVSSIYSSTGSFRCGGRTVAISMSSYLERSVFTSATA